MNKKIPKKQYLIGLTGQTGAGKTTVSNVLKDYGYGTIEADIVSKKTTSSPPCLDEIVKHFGEEILDPVGKLNRNLLSKIVFTNSEKLKLLNKITHPYIINDILNIIMDMEDQIIVIDAPTLIESGLYNKCDYIVAIISPVETRVERIMKRDGINYILAQKRILAQNKEYFYTQHADIVIDNTKRAQPDLQTKSIHLAKYIQNKFVSPIWN